MIPVNEPSVGERELRYVTDAVKGGWVSSEGSYLRRFEELWAAYCGMGHGIACANGTVALELAVAALDLPKGSEIILPSFTIISCAQAVVRNGCTPVFVDADPETWCMDVNAVSRKATSRTRAVMPVHMYGHPVDMDPVVELAHKNGWTVIEDAAEAHGAEYKGRKAGGLGDLSCFSFYANKIVTTGEGGMVLTRDAARAERLRSLRNLCFNPNRRFIHETLGFNYRLTNVQAAIGVAQIERIDETVAHKRWMADAYRARLQHLPELQLPVERPWAKNVYWMFGVVLTDRYPGDAAEFATKLASRGVMTRPFFIGMHEQPALRELGVLDNDAYPVTERLGRRGLYLPSGQTLSNEQLQAVCDAVEACVRETRR